MAKATHALEALRILVHERRLERRRITRVSPITGIEEIITTVQSKSLYQLRRPGRTLHLCRRCNRVHRVNRITHMGKGMDVDDAWKSPKAVMFTVGGDQLSPWAGTLASEVTAGGDFQGNSPHRRGLPRWGGTFWP